MYLSCLILTLGPVGIEALPEQPKKTIAVIDSHEATSADVRWDPSDFGKRLDKALEKTKAFTVVDRKKLEQIKKKEKYYGRMAPAQEGEVKQLGAQYIVYAAIKDTTGGIYGRNSNARVVIGLTIVDLANNKVSDEVLITGEAIGEGVPAELRPGDRQFLQRDRIETLLEDAGKTAIKKAAENLASRSWGS